MQKVFVAGATGYLGRFICSEYRRRGARVVALARNAQKARASGLDADEIVEAEATEPETLTGALNGVDLVVSSLGITRQKNGLSYRDVDYQANLNLLTEAIAAGVPRFAYVHVLGADRLRGVALIDAKIAFVEALQSADIASTVIAPSGYFSDMGDFLAMAKSGRAYLFGDGQRRLNPIHGADLAVAIADAVAAGARWKDVGGPDIFTHRQLAELAFAALGKPARITHLPDLLRRLALAVLPVVSRAQRGPVQFFLAAFGLDMVGDAAGTHHLTDFFAETAQEGQAAHKKTR